MGSYFTDTHYFLATSVHNSDILYKNRHTAHSARVMKTNSSGGGGGARKMCNIVQHNLEICKRAERAWLHSLCNARYLIKRWVAAGVRLQRDLNWVHLRFIIMTSCFVNTAWGSYLLLLEMM